MKQDNSREQRGIEIAEKQDQIKRIDNNWYQVKSQSLSYDSWYDVISTEKGFVCDCPDNQERKVKCKHIHAVEFSLKIREQVRIRNGITIEQLNVSICPHCNSGNIVKHGIRHNDNYDIQRWYCNECQKWFSFNIGFEKMRSNQQAITSAMQLYFTGESLRSIQKFLRLQGIEVSHQAIYKWIKKYTKLMDEYLKTIQPQVGDKWRADELFLKVSGNMKYLYALMDDETRFWIAQQVSANKYKDDISQMLRDGKELTGKKPTVFITDGARNFHQAYQKEFWTQRVSDRTVHIQHIHFKKDMNNNKMERMNGEIRDREKVVRGLKKEDSPMIAGLQVYHNYIRPHMALDGMTPSEACGIKVEGDNKWLTIIQKARREQNGK